MVPVMAELRTIDNRAAQLIPRTNPVARGRLPRRRAMRAASPNRLDKGRGLHALRRVLPCQLELVEGWQRRRPQRHATAAIEATSDGQLLQDRTPD